DHVEEVVVVDVVVRSDEANVRRELPQRLADHLEPSRLAARAVKPELPEEGRVKLEEPLDLRSRCCELQRLLEPAPLIGVDIAAVEEGCIPEDMGEHGGDLAVRIEPEVAA